MELSILMATPTSYGRISLVSFDVISRLLTKSTSGVLASLRGSTYGRAYDSPLRSLRPCWMAFLNSLRGILRTFVTSGRVPFPSSFLGL